MGTLIPSGASTTSPGGSFYKRHVLLLILSSGAAAHIGFASLPPFSCASSAITRGVRRSGQAQISRKPPDRHDPPAGISLV